MDSDTRSPVQRYRARKQDLWSKRSSYDPVCRELSEYVSPHSGRWSTSSKNRGDNKHEKIFDSTGTGAWMVLQAGMVSGLANPASTWLRLSTSNAELNQQHEVREWLDDTGRRLLHVFRDSNTYAALSHYFGEMALFGTACGVILEDEESVIHHYPLTFGEYALATDDKGTVNTMVREFTMSTAQLVQRFGLENVSRGVQEQYRRGNLDQEITVCHLIEPRALRERDPNKIDGVNMPWRSCYFEDSKNKRSDDGLLSESGYRAFPVVAPRWRTIGANTYGEGPANDAINPIKRLQKMTIVEGKAAAFQAEPVVQMPPGMKNQGFYPGARIEVPVGQEVRPIWQPSSRLQEVDVLVQRAQQEIEARFFKGLFTAITDVGRQITAYQAREIAGERLSQLGPTIGRADRELLAPMVDITLGHMFDRGDIAPPPPSLENMEIRPELMGVLAQAQKATGAQTSDALQMKIQSVSETDPSVRHLWNVERDIRDYADIIGAPSELLNTPERYQELVEAEAQAQAAQQQTDMMQQHASAARDATQAAATERQA